MRILREERPGFRTCGAPRNTAEPTRCPGYMSAETTVVVEEQQWTFLDCGSDGTPGLDHNGVARSSVTIKPKGWEDEAAWLCPHCGAWCSFSLTPREDYEPASGQNPDALLSLAQDQAAASHRQADALETLVAQGQDQRRIAALEAELADLRTLVGQTPPKRERART
jgi:hypothetical protein